MKIRCKFVVTAVETPEGWAEPYANVTLEAHYDGEKSDEDVSFAKYTPSGTLKFACTNPAVLEQLKLGDAYYLDLIPIQG